MRPRHIPSYHVRRRPRDRRPHYPDQDPGAARLLAIISVAFFIAAVGFCVLVTGWALWTFLA